MSAIIYGVKPKRIRLFIKPYCGWCHKAIRWLEQRGIEYEPVDVIADEAAFDEMIGLSGQELAPVIEVDGEILSDFGPEELAEFWQRLERERQKPVATVNRETLKRGVH